MLSLDLQSRQPIYEQLVRGLSELVSLGALAPDEQLPSVRSLARDLGVNPNTVQKAYQELERSGVIYSVAGRGSFVSPGPAAARMLRGQSLEKLKEAAAEGRRAGIPREEALGAVEAAYEEGTDHD
ncbi:GntR family transcriptional regulator [uncultured Anaerotruncus sp.]|uniref:GntR family transcriptional regulator n=1 Tax=uncultured Anaerotruncus sp. TaxID=905011 RepID=UPI00280A4E42|nr:GntR family transcriptional regulator [uncultured Anaerotruncus sp.]